MTKSPPPEKSTGEEEWWSKNSLVMTWLWFSMEPSIASNVQLLDTAKKIWDFFEEMYSQEYNASWIYELFKHMFNTKQGNKSLVEHYNILKG